MARYAIHAPTLVYLVDEEVPVHATHQLVASRSIRSDALQLLLRDVSAGVRTDAQALACHEKLTEVKDAVARGQSVAPYGVAHCS